MKTNKKNVKNKKSNNKTKKCLNYLSKLPENQKKLICNKYANNYRSFENKLEEVFKKNKIDILSSSFNLEKQIVKELK